MTNKARPSDIFLKPSHNAHNAAIKRPEKRKSPEPDKDSPAGIRRKIEKTFNVAQEDLKDFSRVKHPSKRNVKLIDAYPMLPDLEAFPDSGAYVTVKFTNNPVPTSSQYDTRLLSGIFKPIERTVTEEQAYDAAMEAYERDPRHNPKPNNMMNYDFYLVDNPGAADLFRKRFDVDNPKRNSDELYPKTSGGGGGAKCFQFQRVRAYETAQETELDHHSKYSEEIVLAYNDDETKGQKAVYYYPVMQRSTVRSQRTKNIARTIGIQVGEEEQIVDQLDVTVDDPSSDLKLHMLRYRERPLGFKDEDEDDDGDRGKATDKPKAASGGSGGTSTTTAVPTVATAAATTTTTTTTTTTAIGAKLATTRLSSPIEDEDEEAEEEEGEEEEEEEEEEEQDAEGDEDDEDDD
jgi:RNA polymerase II-associated factor 1